MIKGTVQEEDIIIVNIYSPNIGAPKYIKLILINIRGEIDSNTIVGYFNTPFTSMDRSTRQVINKETQALKEPSYAAGWNVNWYRHYGKQYANNVKN